MINATPSFFPPNYTPEEAPKRLKRIREIRPVSGRTGTFCSPEQAHRSAARHGVAAIVYPNATRLIVDR